MIEKLDLRRCLDAQQGVFHGLNILALCAFCFTFAFLCVGCGNKEDGMASDKTNAVYYWRTTLDCDSVERDFLRANKVDRAYVRFFDIVVDESPIAIDSVVPNATLQVKDSLPVKDIVPTIYITPEAIAKMHSNESVWAEKIVRRIYNMCSYNELTEPEELQLDCRQTIPLDKNGFLSRLTLRLMEGLAIEIWCTL